jgi:hypothetical protein
MTQENVKVLGNVYRKATDINADTTLDLYDTGRLLVVSGTSALTCSLPAVSNLTEGWNVAIVLASDHSHSVDGMGALGFGVSNAVAGVEALTNISSLKADNDGAEASKIGTIVEIFFDGIIYHIRTSGTDSFTSA